MRGDSAPKVGRCARSQNTSASPWAAPANGSEISPRNSGEPLRTIARTVTASPCGARKRDTISNLVCHGASLARLDDELQRCEVVCANCHRRRTAKRQGSRRLGDAFAAATNRPLRDRNLRFLFERLTAEGCIDYGCCDLVVLDFDHVDEKTAPVLQLAHRECSLARLESEIAKCDVRCANCHRRRTAVQFGYYRHRAAEAA